MAYDVQKDDFLLVHILQGILVLLSCSLVTCTEVSQASLIAFFEVLLFLSRGKVELGSGFRVKMRELGLVALLLLCGQAVSVENEGTVKRVVRFSLGFDNAF